ncbi:MAG TPA: TonB-dependent receptor [Opitutaceae bacterium]|nr:TonB-dependent receptor [Opitutaceae bacterium]
MTSPLPELQRSFNPISTRRRALAGLAFFCGALTSLAQVAASDTAPNNNKAPADKDEVVRLDSFVVSTTRDQGYRPGNSVSATRIDTPIKDLPFSISAFTQQFIEDTGATDLYDVVRYAAGVNSFAREFQGGNAQYTIRGFSQGVLHDGFSGGDIYVDTLNVERVEVVKGPASLLYGQIQPGGIVNYITKIPKENAFTKLTGSYGSYSYARGAVDYNQPLIPHKLLFRFNAGAENGLQWQDPAKSVTKVIAPSASWNVTPNVLLRVAAQHFQRPETPPALYRTNMEISTPENLVTSLYNAGYPGSVSALTNKTGPDVGISNDSSDPGFLLPYPALPRNFNYGNSDDFRVSFLRSVTAEADAKIGEHWVARINFNANENDRRYYQTGIGNTYMAPPDSMIFSNGVWSVAPSWTALTAAQKIAAELAFAQQILGDIDAAYATQNGTPAPVLNPRRQRYLTNWGEGYAVQGDFAGHYDIKWAKINPVLGFSFDHSKNNSQTWLNAGTPAAPYYRTWDVNPKSPTYFIDRDPANPVSNTALSTYSGGNQNVGENAAGYGVVNAQFLDDRLFAVAGARYTKAKSKGASIAANGTVGTFNASRTQSYTSPQFGAGYKVTRDSMLYASYSTSFTANLGNLQTPQIVDGVWKTIATGQQAPTTGKGYEVGYKTDFLNGRISSTVAVYQIEQRDVVQTFNVIMPTTPEAVGATVSTTVQGTEVRSRGVELETTLSPTDNWQIYLSIAENDVRNSAEPYGFAYYLGAHPNGSVKTLANLWTRYNFTMAPVKGLWIGGGFNYAGDAAADNRNKDFILPSYWVFNAAVGYEWKWGKTKMSATLNANNLADKDYFVANQEQTTPRRVVFQVSALF